MSEKDLYSEVKKRKMEALGKASIVKAVEQKGKVLSIKGQYDQPDKVMNYCYAAVKDTINANQFNKTNISNYDLVVIGCPGNEIPSEYHIRFRDYVANGGWILSTDWVLRTIVEPIFPGYISWNGEKTADTVVDCQIVEPSHPFMHGVIDSLKGFKGGDESKMGPKSLKAAQGPGLQPTFKWWLEDKSFPISVLNPQEVKVLIRSYEIGKKWRADPVFVYFNYGKGLVAHIISHTHLQKGASKGKFASAIILTNLLDECIKHKYGLESGRQRGGYQDTNAPAGGISSSPSWEQSFSPVGGAPAPTPPAGGGYSPYGSPKASKAAPTTGYSPYALPSEGPASYAPDPAQGVVPDFGGVAQAVEIQMVDDSTKMCSVCGQDFASSSGKIFECNACKAVYHEDCVQQQINSDGTCKSCSKVLLF